MYSPIEEKNKSFKFCFFDAETYSLNLHNCWNLAWQTACLLYEGGKHVSTYNRLIKWPKPPIISAIAAIKTGFSIEKINKYGIEPRKAILEIVQCFDWADYIVGHNLIQFDAFIMQSCCRESGIKPYNLIPKVIDTLSLAKGYRLDDWPKNAEDFIPWQIRMSHIRLRGGKLSLGALAKEFEIPFDPSRLHDAEYDLLINKQVFDRLKYNLKF